MSNLVVKQDRPLHMLLIVVLVTLSLSFSIWLFLDKSHWSFISAKLSGNQQMQRMWEVNRNLEDENIQLKDQVLWLERTAKIDKEASQELRKELVRLQDEFYKLKGELEFYQGIMASTQDSKGLNVQGLYLENFGKENLYRYRLILTNVTKTNQVAEGIAHVTLEGEADGKRLKYDFQEIAGSVEVDWEFKFKNFKRFEGNIIIPDGFNPSRITVELSTKGKHRKIIERTFDWLSLIS